MPIVLVIRDHLYKKHFLQNFVEFKFGIREDVLQGRQHFSVTVSFVVFWAVSESAVVCGFLVKVFRVFTQRETTLAFCDRQKDVNMSYN